MTNRVQRTLARCYLVVFFLAITAMLVWSFGARDVSFESSEGDWADSEVLFKGRDYEMILALFEKYKSSCGRPNATLFRITEQNWYNVIAWWSYIHDAKWTVPYGPPRRKSYYEPPCAAK